MSRLLVFLIWMGMGTVAFVLFLIPFWISEVYNRIKERRIVK